MVLRQLAIGVVALIAVLTAECGAVATAQTTAQTWPDRPVKIVMPYPPGGGGDAVARVIAQKLGELFRQRFLVEHRPGASGMIGANVVAKADPDGHTLLVASPVEDSLAPSLFKTMSYDPLTELAPISQIAWTPLIIAAHPSFPASTPTNSSRCSRKSRRTIRILVSAALSISRPSTSRSSSARSWSPCHIAEPRRRSPMPSAGM